MVHVVIYITATQSVVHEPVSAGKMFTVYEYALYLYKYVYICEINVEIESKCLDKDTYLVNE